MILRPDAGGLLTISAREPLEIFRLVLRPKFCFGPMGFFCHCSNPMAVTSRIAGCLLPVLAGGSTINSSSQILVNSTGEQLSAARPCRVVAWPTQSHCAPVSPRDSDLFLSQAAVWSHMTASESSASHPTWASGKSKFKLMSRPVTSWPERGAARDQPLTFDTSQDANVFSIDYIPCTIHSYHQ
jgi:hypothetical protein